MKALLAVRLSGALLVGCARKLAGEYTGKLTESSDIMKDGRLIQVDSKTDATFRIVSAGDKLSTVVRECTLLLAPTAKRDEVDVAAARRASFPFRLQGTATAKGTLSREGRWLNAVFSFQPVEREMSGTLVVLFSGTVP
jgi:hypothetical protein